MRLDPVETLQRLIQTPSVNPMGRDVSGPIFGEAAMTELLLGIAKDMGWQRIRQPVHDGRANVLMLVGGSLQKCDEFILWDVHQDTVPVEGMTIDPFAGDIRDGRVYGRGASDVKGSMAAMLAALSRLPKQPADRQPAVVLACTANEECGFTGARLLSATMERPAGDAAPFFPRLPDAAIVAEPTRFEVVVAHQGQVRWRCHTHGRAAHSSRPDAGVNAIYSMAQVVQAIERYHKNSLARAAEHPLCGRPSVCVSTIRGGVGINTVPDHATIEIDRRIGPNDSPLPIYEELIQFIAENAEPGDCRIEHDTPFMQSTGLSDAGNRVLGQQMVNLLQRAELSSKLVGVPYGTDAAAISATGVPTVVFGPGSIEQAHTADEYIAIDQLELATEVFYRIASEGVR